jgi:hypothetical protein
MVKVSDPEVAGRNSTPNPYTGPGPQYGPGNQAVFKLKCLMAMGVGVFFLDRLAFYGAVIKSPHVSHTWFKVGLGLTIGKAVLLFLSHFCDPFSLLLVVVPYGI